MKPSSYILVALLALVPAFSLSAQRLPVESPRRSKNFNKAYSHSIWRQPTKGEETPINALVLLGSFNDVSFTYSKEQFREVLSTREKSAEQYLQDQLGYKISIDIFGPYQAPKKRSYYGTNGPNGSDQHPGEFISEICKSASSDVDFSKYDFDADGKVDNVFVIYSGGDEAFFSSIHPDYLWSHSWSLSGSDFGKTLNYNGKTLDRYACSSEIDSFADMPETISQIGSFCHEFLHTLGLFDYYDADYEKSGGQAAGCWNKTSIMDGGGYNNYCKTPPNLNAVSREALGLLVPEELVPGKYEIHPIGSEKAKTYKITNANDPKEYYLLECRSNESWDEYIGGKGMLVYHIDKSDKYKTMSEWQSAYVTSEERWASLNEINCRPDHQCCDLIEADGRVDKDPTALSLGDPRGVFFPQSGAHDIGGTANVKLPFWDGSFAGILIKNISLSSEGIISFDAYSADSPLPPTPVEPPKESENVYIIVQTVEGESELSVSNSVGATVEWFFGGKPVEDPEHFKSSDAGEIKAIINWSDGTVDKLYKQFRP